MEIREIEGIRVMRKVPEYLKQANIGEDDLLTEFDGLYDYKNFMKQYEDFNEGYSDSSMKVGSWSGSYTYADFLDILESGDNEVMSAMKKATTKEVNELAKKYEDVIHGFKFDVSGQFFDVGLVLAGVPEAWLEPEVEQEEKVQVEIVIDGAFSAGVNKDKIIKNGSRILAMTKLLEELDVEVRLRIVSGNVNYRAKGRNKIYMSTLIKDYDEPINYKKVSALISPTYHRRGIFKLMEVETKGKVSGGYGRPHDTRGFVQMHNDRAINDLEKRLFKGAK